MPLFLSKTLSNPRNSIYLFLLNLSKIDPHYQLVSPSPETIEDDEELENYIRENFDHNHHQQKFTSNGTS